MEKQEFLEIYKQMIEHDEEKVLLTLPHNLKEKRKREKEKRRQLQLVRKTDSSRYFGNVFFICL